MRCGAAGGSVREPSGSDVRRIICIGHPFAESDSAGARVFARLAAAELPPDVEVVDGGLRGIDLLSLVESSERVVFVDTVSGFAAPGDVVALEADSLEDVDSHGCDHAGGFSYLLRSLPYLIQPPVPVSLIGLEGPVDEEACDEAHRLALALITRPAAAALSGAGA